MSNYPASFDTVHRCLDAANLHDALGLNRAIADLSDDTECALNYLREILSTFSSVCVGTLNDIGVIKVQMNVVADIIAHDASSWIEISPRHIATVLTDGLITKPANLTWYDYAIAIVIAVESMGGAVPSAKELFYEGIRKKLMLS